jgi:ABC-type sugar transport system substrate-binding protein
MHGFLRTAEAMGCPAKIYRANTAQLAVEAVDMAIADHCAGLVIWNKDDAYAQAIEKAEKAGMPVVTPYYETDNRFVRASVVVDQTGCMEEVARVIAERMVERDCKGGKILVYGHDPLDAYLEFSDAVKEYYPQYNVAYLARTASEKDAAISELAEYILWNRDVKGLFCIDADGADIAVRARTQAQRAYRNDGAPEQREGAVTTPAPAGATPVPESLTKSITITIVGTGISEKTIELLHDYDIYAFVLEPYYEAAAQSTMVLDQLLRGESAPEISRLNMPIVRQAALDKYELVYRQVREWFDLDAAQTDEQES